MINNTFYLLEQFSANSSSAIKGLSFQDSDEQYRLEDAQWFKEKVGNMFQSQKELYLAHWDILNKHLTTVNKNELVYQKDKLLSKESGRLIKSRFSSFIEDFEEIYQTHKCLKLIDEKLRVSLQNDVRNVFLPRYTEFYEKYAKIHFSKKNQESYLKYPPARANGLISELYEIL